MSDQYEAGNDMDDKRSGPPADDAGRKTEDDEEWVDEAEGGTGTAAQAEWVEERDPDWVEDQPAQGGKAKPKETPAYMTWVAGVVGLLLGLFAFRACGK